MIVVTDVKTENVYAETDSKQKKKIVIWHGQLVCNNTKAHMHITRLTTQVSYWDNWNIGRFYLSWMLWNQLE
jgi:hypothetical protein